MRADTHARARPSAAAVLTRTPEPYTRRLYVFALKSREDASTDDGGRSAQNTVSRGGPVYVLEREGTASIMFPRCCFNSTRLNV